MTRSEYSVVWPRSEMKVEFKSPAPRLDSLDNKTIAFVWDYVFRGDEIWDVLKARIAERYTGVTFVGPDGFGKTHGGDEHRVLAELPGKLKARKVDAVISGVGC